MMNPPLRAIAHHWIIRSAGEDDGGSGGCAAEPISGIRLRQHRCYGPVTRAPAPRNNTM